MSMLKLENVTKVFPGKGKKDRDVIAVSDFNLEVKEKEFIVFVGPSGCGKSTTLRMIAGLEENTKGNIYIDDELMNNVEPKYRNIAMVFQNYALYPHMSARENMSFGLKNMKVPTPVLDKEGHEVKGIDKKLLSSIKAEEKRNNKEIARLEKLQAHINSLNEEINSGNLDDKKLEAKKLELSKLDNRFDLDRLNKALEKREQIKKDYEYYSKNEVVLHVNKHLPKEEIKRRVEEAAKILEIEDLLDRKPKAMSGGQRQRVALGRAIVRTPKIFLLDEPLSNLDAKLRTQMRVEIVNLYNKLNTPFVYVTHDQVEAMTMGTRIVVMRSGVVQQIDTPTNLYDNPRNRFVAGFLGTPQMNFFEVNIKKVKDNLEINLPNENKLSVKLSEMRELMEEYLDGNEHKVILGIRSEDISLAETKDIKGLNLTVKLVETLGSETLLYTDFVDGETSIKESETTLIIKVQGRPNIQRGDKVNAIVNHQKLHFFSLESGEVSIFKE